MAKGFSKDQPKGFSNRIEKVAIVGAGGTIGTHITEYILKSKRQTLTAITRPESTKQFPDGVKVARVNYSGEDDGALVEALLGQQVLIITMTTGVPHTIMSTLFRAAAKANVSYIFPNWYGPDHANDDMARDTLFLPTRDRVCEEIESLGVSSYIMLNCGLWYEFSLGGGTVRYGFDFKTHTYVQFDDGNEMFNTTTLPQCGRAIANLLNLKELPDDEADTSPTLSQFSNKGVYVSSFRLNQNDMFASVKRVTDTTDADWSITNDQSIKRWEDNTALVKEGKAGVANYITILYSRLFFPQGDGDYESSRGLQNELLNLPVENLDDFTAIGIRMGENEEVRTK